MKNFRQPVAALVLFVALVSLILLIYNGVTDSYGLTQGDDKTIDGTTGNIFDQFESLNLIEGINQITNGLISLNPATGSIIDVLGGLVSVGLGALKTITGLITAPYSIIKIVLVYYGGVLPGKIFDILLVLVSVYVAFILLSRYFGWEI